ncbi:MAG TPA: AAA family ATPase [Candidatus Aquabacterium excrementipullorum]|nr:AAA family ATPase [Candidatus Aquabacterium excrementipullorum]
MSTVSSHSENPPIASTGIPGLDKVLRGGLPTGRLYLLEGKPGAGKTTAALQFLLEGVKTGEPALYITLSETSEELLAVADSHGWSLDGIELFELAQASDALGAGTEQTLLHAWEVELSATVQLITARVEKLKAKRVVFDSLSEMRLLAQDSLRYRRQVLALKQYFAERHITTLLIDDMTDNAGERDAHLHSLSHGVITLDRLTLDFGGSRRRLQVQKLRGVNFVEGYHDLVLRRGGMVVFPRLIASEHRTPFIGDPVSSGIPELDELLHGGLRRGTSTLISGPAGAGKTNIALKFAAAACARGERVAIYEFDERIGTLLQRARLMGLDLQACIDAGSLAIRQVDPAEISPGEFAALIQEEVEQRQVRMVVLDSLSGYLSAMPQENQLVLQMHELLSYLNQQGVLSLLINAQQSLVGTMSTSGINISYLSDVVLLLRFFESEGRIRKALSVIKNRGGSHEETIRELRIDSPGLRIGEALTAFRGVLTGVPEYIGSSEALMEQRVDAP